MPDEHPHNTLQTRLADTKAGAIVYPLLANILVKLPCGQLGNKPQLEQESDLIFKPYLLYAKLAKNKNPEFQVALRQVLSETSMEDSAAKEIYEAGVDYSPTWKKVERRVSLRMSWNKINLDEAIKEEEDNSKDVMTGPCVRK